MFSPVYLDHNASAPLVPAAREAMLPFLGGVAGNASSRHEYGRRARAAIEHARQQVAEAVGAHPTEVVFTSGGSESNNLFLKGAAAALKPACLALGATEHPCVREAAQQLTRHGWSLAVLPVDVHGVFDENGVAEVLARRPALVSAMLANNETGVLNDIAALSLQVRRQGGCWLHTDAVQALGKTAVDFRALGVHAMTLSAHKIGGPVGAGALVVDKRIELHPLIAGGGQERGLRSGTENVAAIAGFGAACGQLALGRDERIGAMVTLRDALVTALCQRGASVFGLAAPRLPNTVFFAFAGIEGETLVARLDRAGFAVASGSACSSANPEPSHTLLAMGVAPELARGAVRVSVGTTTTDEDCAKFVAALDAVLAGLRGLAAVAA